MATKATGEAETSFFYQQRIQPYLDQAPWILRITDHKDKPSPVCIVKERFTPSESQLGDIKKTAKATLKDRGLLYGAMLRRCMPVMREILGRVNDPAGIPLELHRFIAGNRLEFRGNLPLSDEAGAKLALLFRLQERVKDADRVELMAWRIERFSREEAIYWLTRATMYGQAANLWAQAGMRIMLGGQPGDKHIEEMLEKLRK